ncbi:hypothetical protein N7456_004644 [Penicillium angulare]|uniref:Xylanolytic transcriptional activator regulatory domain-containing protein n=1 Tax=Penicillium angulare TaxID=116970 RepID=A0A9W9KIK1_9EURO|nr:hypothetical protein N7456_004644 [Penicillium angulare]
MVNHERVPDARSNAKRVRQDSNEQVEPRDAQLVTPHTRKSYSNPPEEHHQSVASSNSALLGLCENPPIPDGQTEALDWDLQWPFYGEGLQDANLDWTLDFLSNGISTHSPLDSINDVEGVMHTIQRLDNPESARGDAYCQSRVHSMQDKPQHQIHREHAPVSPESQRAFCGASGFATDIHPDENNASVEGSSPLRVKIQVSDDSRTSMVDTVTATLLDNFCSQKDNHLHLFPPSSIIDHFMNLFFLHVQPRFPVLHMPTFDPNKTPPTLLLAMAIAGSSYSESNQGKFASTYLERARMSMKLMQEKDRTHLLDHRNLFALFLVSLSAMWIGQKLAYERLEVDRGDLAVYCRRIQLLDCRTKGSKTPHNPSRNPQTRLEEMWLGWINDEEKKRLGLCIYLLDCQISAFFQRQPHISKAETVNAALPCSDTFWNAPTVWAWKSLLGPADIPPSTYYLTTLTTILLHNEIPDVLPFPPLDDFCKTLYAYVLHTHIFEWRQTISMLNPTGLLSSPLSLAPQHIGDSLQERRRWLEVCLGNWATFYGSSGEASSTNPSPNTSSGILLYRLALLALRLNFSDLHVVAGRAGSNADIELAEQSLRNWLQGERVQKIFDINSEMLNTAHDVIAAGHSRWSGFELSICLFMGGLTSWVISRFGDMNLVSTSAFSQSHHDSRGPQQGDTSHFVEGYPQGRDSLIVQIEGARNGLRVLKFLRLAIGFSKILNRLLNEPIRQ